jgi:hypothetical protein
MPRASNLGSPPNFEGMYNDSLNAQRYKQNPSMGNMLRNLF